uniref:AP-5 complex subunit beta-1 n=1 Tax=Cyprinus carpio TaxID=7962 RepID=A0A8C1XLT0_CYPCA
MEHPTILCPSASVGEETALELLSVFPHTPQKSIVLKCNVMLAITNVIICTSCLNTHTKTAEDWLDLCGLSQQPIRATACDCLREMETCSPGLLSQKLEALYLLKQQETTVLHQSYCLLYTLGLKNAIRILTNQKDVTDLEFKSILGGNEGFAWKSIQLELTSFRPGTVLNFSYRELKSIMSLLLEESYLLMPIWELVEVVAMVPGLSPTLFKSQLLRLFGTADVSLMHATLFMKDTFTDSLFTTEDENFLLKRLVGMAQHPLLRITEKLFYMECILVKRTKESASCFDHIMALLKIVDNDGSREVVVTSLRALFIFLMHFSGMEELSEKLIDKLCDMYSRHSRLAPNLIGLADRIQEHLDDPVWSVKLLRGLQKRIMEMPPLQLTIHNLSWHLKVLKRVAKEGQITQRNTIYLLLNVLINSNLCERGNWQVGNAVLAVYRNLLDHPSIDQVFIELADLLNWLEVYQGQFQTPGFGSEVTLRYNLTHAKETDPLFDKVFTICLHFELKDSNYAKVTDIHVPCVFRDRKSPEVKVKLKPFQPYPTSLCVSAMFTTQDGRSWHSRLPDVSVSFPEIFLPLPLPPNSSRECREQVFERIWEATASGNPDKSAISLFCFKPEDESLADLTKTHFQGYLITDQQSERSWKVLLFLPPKCHILLKITQAEDAAQVSIATDNQELLPFPVSCRVSSALLKEKSTKALNN